jgi:hypothetical protein
MEKPDHMPLFLEIVREIPDYGSNASILLIPWDDE